MIRHDKIARHPRTSKTLTGLSAEGFKQFLPPFERARESDLGRRDAGRVRRRAQGEAGGHGGQTRVYPGLFPLYPIPAGLPVLVVPAV